MKFTIEEERFLKDNEVGRLATISENGLPHVVPVCYIYRSGSLWIATDYGTGNRPNTISTYFAPRLPCDAPNLVEETKIRSAAEMELQTSASIRNGHSVMSKYSG